MSVQSPNFYAIQATYQTGFNLYAVIHNAHAGTVWNTSTSAFETFTAGNWANYAIPLTEQTGTGYYSATFPGTQILAAASAVFMTEAIYVRAGASPTIGDIPALNLTQSQGVNVASILGNYTPLFNMLVALSTESVLTVQSVPSSTTIVPVTIPSTNPDNYIGRALVFAPGGAAAQQAYRILAYLPSTGQFTLTAPLLTTPNNGDQFVII